MERQEISIDFNKICRLCMTEESQMTSMFLEETNVVPLPLRIMSLVSIEITATDLLPSQICYTCLAQVDNWYKFKELCEHTDVVLKRLASNDTINFNELTEIQENGRQLKSKFVSKSGLSAENATDEIATADNHQNHKSGEIKQEKEPNQGEDRLIECEEDWNSKPLQSLSLEYSGQLQLETDDESDNLHFSYDEYSSDDSLTLLAHREKLLKDKQETKSKTRKEVVQEKRLSRTMQTQTGTVEDCMDSALEISISEIAEIRKKKKRNKRTQTFESKKRFRIRPAVPSACTLCEKVYKNGEILRQHIKSHHVSGTIECQQCQATFTSLRSLKYHEQRNHSNLEPVPCSFCGKEFLDKKYLRIHENIHSKANQYVCQYCGRNFIMKTNLTVHISRHHTEKTNDFICQVCGKAFPFKLYLKKHFKTHTDYKPHCCSQCDARFRESTLLRKHINSIHLKLRPFLCTYCQKTFTRSLYLREHMDSQHLGNPRKVECDRCGEVFNNRTKLRNHDCQENLQIL